ncbi:MAG: hypothetical protein GX267_17920 [Fibrobacter sp.]|jgi:ligand-binding sensor domain-containing protein|nr:hypothetical protein [Fibrobacter sp.]
MPLEKMIRGRTLSGMVVDKDGYLWLSAYDDYSVVARYDGSEWMLFFNEDIGTDLSGDLLSLCPMGNVVAVGPYGISIFKNGKWETILETRQPINYRDICFPDTNQFIFTTGYAPSFHTTGVANIWVYRNRLENNDIRMIAVDRNNNLWLSCYASQWGIQKFDGTSWKNYINRAGGGSGKGPIHNSVYSCAIDSIGGIWFGHDFGLSYFFNDKWTIFGEETGLPYIRVGSCLVAKDGKVWVGCQGGVMIYDGIQWTTFDTSDGLPDVISVSALAESNDGTIWSGTYNGVAWFENGRFHHDTGNGGPGNRIIRSIETSPQNKIIVTTSRGAFVKINKQNWIQIIGDDTICAYIEIDQQGRIWVSTTGSGIIVFDENLNRIRNIDVGLPYGFVDNLVQNHNGSMWAATPYGLALITVYNSASIDNRVIKRPMNSQPSRFIGIYDIQGRKVSDGITLNRRRNGASGNYIYTDNNVVKKLLKINK